MVQILSTAKLGALTKNPTNGSWWMVQILPIESSRRGTTKSHQRQLVDGSDPFYRELEMPAQDPAYKRIAVELHALAAKASTLNRPLRQARILLPWFIRRLDLNESTNSPWWDFCAASRVLFRKDLTGTTDPPK